MKKIFEQAIANVQTSYPSVYTKEDVVILINDLLIAVEAADLDNPMITSIVVDTVKEALLENVKKCSMEDLVELSIGYGNCIEVSFDYDGMLDSVDRAFDEAVASIMP